VVVRGEKSEENDWWKGREKSMKSNEKWYNKTKRWKRQTRIKWDNITRKE
jgi:hypothetical protein